jgi:hypothetical protein
MSENESLTNTIRRIYFREDAGVSADPTPANNAGAGKVDGIGVGPRGEPGAAAWKRRRKTFRRDNPKLVAALAKQAKTRKGVVELDKIREDWEPVPPHDRFYAPSPELIELELALQETGDATVRVDGPPLDAFKLAKAEHRAKKKRKGKDTKYIEYQPELKHHPRIGEGVLHGSRPTVRIDLLIRYGLGDIKRINYYRQAIRDPEAAVRNPTLRPFVGEVLEQTLDLIFNDAQLYNRFRALLQKWDTTRGENELPEEVVDEVAHLRKFILEEGGTVEQAVRATTSDVPMLLTEEKYGRSRR